MNVALKNINRESSRKVRRFCCKVVLQRIYTVLSDAVQRILHDLRSAILKDDINEIDLATAVRKTHL